MPLWIAGINQGLFFQALDADGFVATRSIGVEICDADRVLAELGAEGFRSWAQGLKANGLRLYDGNSSVVRAAANGEIDVGLTDTDDVYSGQKQGWPLAMVQPGAKRSSAFASLGLSFS